VTAGQTHLDGLEADAATHLTFLGARIDLDLDDDSYQLGESVAFTIKGHVVMVGAETLETDGVRRVVKVRCDLIEAK